MKPKKLKPRITKHDFDKLKQLKQELDDIKKERKQLFDKYGIAK